MIDRVRTRRSFPAPTPVGDQQKLPCSTCRARVDPLRAARVAIFDDRFHYFCSPECRVRFVPGTQRSLPPPPVPAPLGPATPYAAPFADQRQSLSPGDVADGVPAPQQTWRGLFETDRASWFSAAVVLGILAAGMASPLSQTLHVRSWMPAVSAGAACIAFLVGRVGREQRSASWGSAAWAHVAPVAATLAAVLGWLLAPSEAAAGARVAGVVCAVAAGSELWMGRLTRSFGSFGEWVARALGVSDTSPEAARPAQASSALKLGEELVLRAGDRVTVDVVITAGRAQVEPWPGSRLRVLRGEGDGLLAGAGVVDGALRAVVRWVGHDRSWARLSVDPARRADRHMTVARIAERLSTRGAAALGVLAGVISFSLETRPLIALGYASAMWAALGNVGLGDLIGLYVAQGVYRLQLRGICFRSAGALDRAGRTSSVVFCDRGTLLSGELSVASIEPSGDLDDGELLGLLAGAYAGVASPIANALQRSLAAHKLRPDATRSPNHLPGLGVTAVASNGQALVAGTRALLLERRISVASAETRIGELEALGRSVLLIALDGRWVGLVALQDGLRPGARAATQTLIDAGVEPVLLSGEARETCRALARHIGIEHVRPEVLPQDRAAEVQRLSNGAGVLAVVGSSIDDAALAAAPLSINIDARGGPLERCDIDIASGDVRDAAAAVQLARALNARTRTASLIALAPIGMGLLLLFAGLPPWVVPILGSCGAIAAARQLRAPA
jgi:cation transport ATPase